MVTGAHGDAEAVEQRAHVQMMNVANEKTDYGILVFGLTENPHSIDGFHLLHAISSEFLLMLLDVVHAQSRDVINGCGKSVGGDIIGVPRLELERKFLENSLLRNSHSLSFRRRPDKEADGPSQSSLP